MRWFVASVTFLFERFHGRSEGERPEWPPSPHRQFQAIVAAAHDTRTWGEQDPAAFRWLERRPPPDILASSVSVGRECILAVPNNDLDKVAKVWSRGRELGKNDPSPEKLKGLKTIRPQFLGGDASVHFCWPIEDSEWVAAKPHVELLCERAKNVGRLGLGIDVVVGNGQVLDDDGRAKLPGELWVTDGAEGAMNIPVAGTLEELDKRFERWSQRQGEGSLTHVPAGDLRAVQKLHYFRLQGGRKRKYYPFALVGPNGENTSFPQDKAIIIAGHLRHAAGKTAEYLGLHDDFVKWYVMGHVDNDDVIADYRKSNRLSYVPLPSIGHRKVNGRIKKALLVEPFSEPPGMPPRAREIGLYLDRQRLVDYQTNSTQAELRPLFGKHASPSEEDSRMIDRYTRRSKRWGSVTPVVLHGHDRYSTQRAAELFKVQLEQSGYYTPATFEIQEEAVFAGCESAGRYLVDEHLRERTRVHATITFAEPVPGPILIGLGRHRGLGTFASLD